MRLSYKTYFKILKSIIKSIFSPTPIIYTWEITYRCNMRCSFCNIWRLAPECYTDEMTTQEGIALLHQAAHLGASLLYLTGGEPLLRKDIGEILRCAKQMRMVTMIGTNGFFIEDEIEQLKANLDCLRVSIDSLAQLDGIRSCHSSLERAVKGIKQAKKLGIEVIINATITSETIGEMKDLAKFADDLHCDITLSPLTKIPKGVKEDNELTRLLPDYEKYAAAVRELKKKYTCVVNSELYLDLVEKGGIGYSDFICKAPHIVLSVNPQGDILLPCNAYPIKRINIKNEDGLKMAWYSKSAGQIKKGMKHFNFCTSCVNRCYILPSLFFTVKGISHALGNYNQRKRIF